jgi:uncharacterized repeat protein (TIGR03847 family)
MNGHVVKPAIFTTDFTGEPGGRTFYLQASTEESVRTFVVEKEQVLVLAERMRDLLVILDHEDTIRVATPARDPALSIREPLDPEWRVGTIALAFDENSEEFIVALGPVGEEDDPEDVLEGSEEAVRFVLRKDQVRAFSLHALAVVGEGRPLCRLCGLPMDPEGHDCPARNGHRLGG